jgi:hypothetical protein
MRPRSGDHVIAGVFWAGPGGNGEAKLSRAAGRRRGRKTGTAR